MMANVEYDRPYYSFKSWTCKINFTTRIEIPNLVPVYPA
jgi:hypothetical protein